MYPYLLDQMLNEERQKSLERAAKQQQLVRAIQRSQQTSLLLRIKHHWLDVLAAAIILFTILSVN